MRLGVSFTAAEPATLTRQRMVEDARMTERAGFDSLWFFDALGREHIHPDPLLALTVAAMATESLEVGTCIMQVPLRHAAELAHRVLTAQLASDNRMTFGVGAGSTKTDFDLVGVDFDSRMRALSDGLGVMRTLWRGEAVNGVTLDPWPSTLGGPPVLIGSWAGSQWIPRAAQEFDGWIGSGAKSTLGALQTGIERFRGLGGKRAMVTNIRCDLSAATASLSEDSPFSLNCRPDEAKRRLAMLEQLGFDDAVLMLPNRDAKTLDALRSLLV